MHAYVYERLACLPGACFHSCCCCVRDTVCLCVCVFVCLCVVGDECMRGRLAVCSYKPQSV